MDGPLSLEALTVIAKLFVSEIEHEHPGALSRAIARLGDEGTRAQVVRIRGARSDPWEPRGQEEALVWLVANRPMMEGPKKGRRR